jgi:hypothetical protein
MTTSNSSVNVKNSRYVQGGLTEVGPIGLEWWSRFDFPKDSSDQIYIIEEKYTNRIDLIAYAFYNEPRWWWIIAQYNNILDPWIEIIPGRKLLIPTLNRLQLLFGQKTGGIQSARTAENVLPPIVL